MISQIKGHILNARGEVYIQQHTMFQLLAHVNAITYTKLFQVHLIHLLRCEKPGQLLLFPYSSLYMKRYSYLFQ